MAFANLFARLSAVEEGITSPGQPAVTHRDETERGRRGRNAKKRKTQDEQTGPHSKRQCHQAQMTSSYNATSDDKNMCHKGQNYKTNNNRTNKQQEQKKEKTEGQKNQHQQKYRGRPAYRGGSHQTRPSLRKGGGDWKNRNKKQDFQVKHPRFMTEEFKVQNVLMVDGRSLCRHFLCGRCIKGDDCQLEHVQGYNDLLKEVCKFYVQGLCTKGENCPYMHKSFPCKFFHRKGKCSQGADCRFSHEPLNDLTSRLLDEALKRDSDLYELAKKAELETSGQPANTEDSESIEANRTPDIFIQPLRPNFYKSADTDAEKDALLCQAKEQADGMEEAVPPHASDAAQPHSPTSTNLNHKEPVCYSVEAVLGPQLSKPFTGFFTAPKNQESTPLSSSNCTSDSANQSLAPYSVDAVLRSYTSVENSTFGYTPTPPTAQTVSYSPEITDPLLSSETQNKKVLCSVNIGNEANKSQEKLFKSLSSLQVHTGLISKTCPDRTLASGDHKKPESPKLAQRSSPEVKLELLNQSTDITCSVNCKSEGALPFGPMEHKNSFSKPPSQTSTPKQPTQLKPHLSDLTSDSQASFKPFCPSSGCTDLKGRAAVSAESVTIPMKLSDSANSVSRHVALKQPTEIRLYAKKTQSDFKLGTKQHDSAEPTAECSSKTAHCGDLAVGCKKTLKRPFHSLFASPITDTLQPRDNSVTSSTCPQGSVQSSCSAPQSADCRGNHLKTALEPDKTTARSFLSLFAAPLPCVQSQPDYSRTSSCPQQSVDNTLHSSDSKQRAFKLEATLPRQVRTDVKEISHVPKSPNFSPSTDLINQPTKQLVTPVCSLVSDSLNKTSTSPTPCGDSASTSHAHQRLPDMSSHKGFAAEPSANSVLKTLFLCLSPYQQDGEQQDGVKISVPSESEKKDKSSMGCVFVKQQRKNKKKDRRKKRLESAPQDSRKQSTERTVAQSVEHRPSLRTPQISLEATGGSTLSSPGMTEPQVRDSGTHNLPFKAVVPLMQHHTRPTLKHTSEEGKVVEETVAATPLKDLFKTLDTAVFHFGH